MIKFKDYLIFLENSGNYEKKINISHPSDIKNIKIIGDYPGVSFKNDNSLNSVLGSIDGSTYPYFVKVVYKDKIEYIVGSYDSSSAYRLGEYLFNNLSYPEPLFVQVLDMKTKGTNSVAIGRATAGPIIKNNNPKNPYAIFSKQTIPAETQETPIVDYKQKEKQNWFSSLFKKPKEFTPTGVDPNLAYGEKVIFKFKKDNFSSIGNFISNDGKYIKLHIPPRQRNDSPEGSGSYYPSGQTIQPVSAFEYIQKYSK